MDPKIPIFNIDYTVFSARQLTAIDYRLARPLATEPCSSGIRMASCRPGKIAPRFVVSTSGRRPMPLESSSP